MSEPCPTCDGTGQVEPEAVQLVITELGGKKVRSYIVLDDGEPKVLRRSGPQIAGDLTRNHHQIEAHWAQHGCREVPCPEALGLIEVAWSLVEELDALP